MVLGYVAVVEQFSRRKFGPSGLLGQERCIVDFFQSSGRSPENLAADLIRFTGKFWATHPGGQSKLAAIISPIPIMRKILSEKLPLGSIQDIGAELDPKGIAADTRGNHQGIWYNYIGREYFVSIIPRLRRRLEEPPRLRLEEGAQARDALRLRPPLGRCGRFLEKGLIFSFRGEVRRCAFPPPRGGAVAVGARKSQRSGISVGSQTQSQYSIAVQHRSTASQYSIAVQHRSTASQYSIAVQHRSTASQYSIAVQHRSTASQYSSRNLLDSGSRTEPRYPPKTRAPRGVFCSCSKTQQESCLSEPYSSQHHSRPYIWESLIRRTAPKAYSASLFCSLGPSWRPDVCSRTCILMSTVSSNPAGSGGRAQTCGMF